MNIGGEYVTINKSGEVMVQGQTLPTSKSGNSELGYTFTKIQYPPGYVPQSPDFNPDVGVRNIFAIERDMRKRAIAISTSHKYWNEKSNEEYVPKNPPPKTGTENMRFEFNYDAKTNECHLNRALADGQHVIYDRPFCDRLSKSLATLTDQELSKCDSVIKEMGRALHSFKQELAQKNLTWKGQHRDANAFGEVLYDATYCRAPYDPDYQLNISLKKFPSSDGTEAKK